MQWLTTLRWMTANAAIICAVLLGTNSNGQENKPDIDAAAEKRMRAMSDFYGGITSFSVDAVHTMETEEEDEDAPSYSDERHITLQQPNLIAATATGDSEGTVVCDGKQLFAHLPSAKQYLLGEAPANLTDLLQEEASFLLGSGRTALQLVAGNSYKQFMDSVTKLALLESERVDNVVCDRIEMSQEQAKLVLWIEQGEVPLLRKMRQEMQIDMPDIDFQIPSQVVRYSNWEVDPQLPHDTFSIELPEDAEQVDTLMDNADEQPHELLGKQSLNCELDLLVGGTQQLSDLQGEKVVMLSFWTLENRRSTAALSDVDQVAAEFADRDVACFAVNLGDEKDDILAFLPKKELKLPVAIDSDSELGDLLKIRSLPMTMILDKQGVVQVVHVGFIRNLREQLTEEIEAVLDGKQLAEETLQAAEEANRWGKPIPAGKDAITSKEALEYAFDYNLRTMVQPYKDVGSRDDTWDKPAIEFLTEMARHFASAEGYKSRTTLIEMAELLLEQDCDDPLVRYCLGAMLSDAQLDKASNARGLSLVGQAYEGLVQRGYPANRCFAAADRLRKKANLDKGQSEQAEKYLELAKMHALECVFQDDLETSDGRTIYGHVNRFADSLTLESRKEFCESAQVDEEASPYLVNMLTAEYHLKAAWKARGGGYAYKVTEEGWEGFAEHMRLARAGFEKAWRVAPHRPEGATAMIKIAMGSSSSSLSEMRMWFDRAVKAQLDYQTAYSHLAYGLMPRWHGSHDSMYEFGVECMQTGRYDTYVPYQLCDILYQIIRDDHNPLGNGYIRKPGLYENTRTLCKNYIEAPGNEVDILWWKTTWLCFAYLAEQWDDAAELLEELGSDLNANALGRVPLAANEVISAVRLHASPHAEAIVKAIDAADNGRVQQATAALEEILAEDNLQPSVVRQLKSRLQGLNWGRDFEKGKAVRLMPKENLNGWRVAGGNWTRTSNGGLQGVSDRSGVMLECAANFGTDWQISGEVTHGKSPYNSWDAGVLLLEEGEPEYSIMFNPSENWVAAGSHKKLKQFRKAFTPDGKTTKFVIRIEEDNVNVWLNGELVIEAQEVPGLSYSRSSRLAIGAKYTWSGSTLTFENLEIEQVEPEE